MKRLVLLFLACAFSVAASAQQLTVASYNLRNDNPKDRAAGNGWDYRCPHVCDIIESNGFDLFGAQEVTSSMLEDLRKRLPEYDYVGVGRDDGKTAGEYSPVFYKKGRFRLLDSDTFWLSERTDVPNRGWDAKYPRICTWGSFRDTKYGRKVWVFNLHLDHVGVVARREGVKLVLRKIAEMTSPHDAVMLMGDFNVDQDNEIYGILTGSMLGDSYVIAEKRFAANGTINAFKPEAWTDRRIDHILVSHSLKVLSYAVPTDMYWREVPAEAESSSSFPKEVSFKRYRVCVPSDHYPVVLKLDYVKGR